MLKIHESSAESGHLSAVFLRFEDEVLEVVTDDGSFALPDGALESVMSRYGAPFDAEARVSRVASLEVGAGRSLHHVRHLAGYDVIARDYLLYEREKAEPLCALATTIAGALYHLGRAAARSA